MYNVVTSCFSWSLSSGGPQAGRALTLSRRALSFEACVPQACLHRSQPGLHFWLLGRYETLAGAPAGPSVTPAHQGLRSMASLSLGFPICTCHPNSPGALDDTPHSQVPCSVKHPLPPLFQCRSHIAHGGSSACTRGFQQPLTSTGRRQLLAHRGFGSCRGHLLFPKPCPGLLHPSGAGTSSGLGPGLESLAAHGRCGCCWVRPRSQVLPPLPASGEQPRSGLELGKGIDN